MKNIGFKINYKNLSVMQEFNTKNFAFPLVLSCPHSGSVFPEEFLQNSNLKISELRSSEDCFVDELVHTASDAGIPMLKMDISRTFIDVNRDIMEIDDTMFFNHPKSLIADGGRRCRVGLGIIHRIIGQNKNIYKGLLDYNEVADRIKNIYNPYHKRLKQLVDRCVKKFGFCLLIDCHSMPSQICTIMNENKPVEFCLCTLFDESCPTKISRFLSGKLQEYNYRVEFNRPYAGAYITFNYCQPRKKIFTLQMEINRALYMTEGKYKKNADFQAVATNISESLIDLGNFLLDFKK